MFVQEHPDASEKDGSQYILLCQLHMFFPNPIHLTQNYWELLDAQNYLPLILVTF